MQNRRQFLKNSRTGVIGAGLMYSLPGCLSTHIAENPLSGFPRSTPEQQGIASAGIRNFLKAANQSDLEFHSFMMLRHGQVVSEGWWAPYASELKHTLYSLSKSFTSTAIGMIVADGKLNVEDTILSLFPELAPPEVSENLAAMKVKHLLTMTTGHDSGTMGGMRSQEDDNWPKAFLAQEVVHEPGTHFLYNTGASYMLSSIVQKLTGKTLFDFLSERLFKPLEIEGADWEVDPKGVNVGGYGLRVKTEDIAKLGQLYLQKGKWKDQQLLPESWVEDATKKQTDSQEGDGDWSQGYGYQFWRCKPAPGFYRGDGAFGQYCIIIPQYDVVIAVTSESFDMGASMKLIWEHILPAISKEEKLTEDEASSNSLTKELKSLTISPPMSAKTSPHVAAISGQTFQLEENPWGLDSMSFNFTETTCSLSLKSGEKTQKLTCGINQWHIKGNDKSSPEDFFAVPGRTQIDSKIAASATWKDENTLLLTLRLIENVHNDQLLCVFDKETLSISFLNSVAVGRKETDRRPELKGSLA